MRHDGRKSLIRIPVCRVLDLGNVVLATLKAIDSYRSVEHPL